MTRREAVLVALVAGTATVLLGLLLLPMSSVRPDVDGPAPTDALPRPPAARAAEAELRPPPPPGLKGRARRESPPPEATRRRPQAAGWGPTATDRRRVRGSLRSDAGLAIPGAEVYLTDHRGRRARKLFGLRGRSTTDAEGRYVIQVPIEGTWGIAARVDGYGTGWTGPIEVRGEAPVEAPDLHVRGDGSFSGVVVFPNGRPVVGVEVYGCVDLSRGGSWSASPYPGIVSMYTRTDATGRFRIGGLRPGPYTVSVDQTEARPKRIHAANGADDLVFVVQRRQLRVQIPNVPGASLARYDPEGDTYSGMPAARGEVVFFGEPRARNVFTAYAEDHVPCTVEAAFPDQQWTRDVVLELRPRGRRAGRIRLHVRDPDGRRVACYRVSVATRETGTKVPWLDRVQLDGVGILDDVPAGAWRLTVEPTTPDSTAAPRFLFPSSVDVRVRAHETSFASIRCRRGGRIRITSTWATPIETGEKSGSIDLEGPCPTPAHWLWPDPEEAQLGPLLEPGRWVVAVEGEGLQSQRIPVDVAPGRIVDMEVHITPK